MLRFLCKRLLQSKASPSPINGDSTTKSPFLQNPSFLIKSLSTKTPTNSFPVSYLINSCGLSEQQALSVSKNLQFETCSKPDSILTFLKNNGFTSTQISKVIQKHPLVLLCNPQKTLQPKLNFFISIGFSQSDLAKLLSSEPSVLFRSLDNQITPSYLLLKRILGSDSKIVSLLKRSTWVLLRDPKKETVPNINILKSFGVPDSNIAMLLITQPRILLRNVDGFKETVMKVKELGFNPSKSSFVRAINGLMSVSNWETKLGVYKRCGFSEEDCLKAFKKQPYCMIASEKKIMSNLDFFLNKMGYKPSVIAEYPLVVNFSLEKRIIPRYLVMQILVANGLVPKDFSVNSVLLLSEKVFLEKFVDRFLEKVPELMKAYKGSVNDIKLHFMG